MFSSEHAIKAGPPVSFAYAYAAGVPFRTGHEIMQSIILIVDYFGAWPEWFPLYLETCKWNPSVHWLFHTDIDRDFGPIPNVEFRLTTKEEYSRRVRDQLGVTFAPNSPHKLCDLRPMYGVLYEEDIRGYDFFGYTDIDVLYGNIRDFYTEEILAGHNVLSTHQWCLSGHLTLMRNVGWLRSAFRRIPDWRVYLEDGNPRRFDEDVMRRVFQYPQDCPEHQRRLYDLSRPWSRRYRRHLYFHEQYTTPLTASPWVDGTLDHPTVWYWRDGRVTNANDGDREFIYLHFMNFKSAPWMNPAYGHEAFWSGMHSIVHLGPEDHQHGIKIDRTGFHSLDA